MSETGFKSSRTLSKVLASLEEKHLISRLEDASGRRIYTTADNSSEVYQDMIAFSEEWAKDLQAFKSLHHEDARKSLESYIRMWALLNLRFLQRSIKHPEREDAYSLVYAWTQKRLISEFAALLRSEKFTSADATKRAIEELVREVKNVQVAS